LVTHKPVKIEINVNNKIELTIPVSNIGKVDGVEIVQYYMRKLNDAGGLFKSLRAFKRTAVKAGTAQDVKIELPSKTFECFDTTNYAMNESAGEYKFL